MTAVEKVEHLLSRFRIYAYGRNDNEMTGPNAISCALIFVDEILKELDDCHSFKATIALSDKISYYKEVKTILQNK